MYLVRSGAATGYEKLVSESGGNPVELMRKAGLSPPQFRNPNTYISYSSLAELLELTAIACDLPLFGLLLARRQATTVLGDLPMLLSQQTTVGEALENIDRYLYLHARGVQLKHQVLAEEVRLELVFEISSPRGLTQLIQLSVGHLANFIAELLAIDKAGQAIFLRQQAPRSDQSQAGPPPYSRVRFEAVHDGVQIPASWLERKAQSNEKLLQAHLEDYLRQLQQRYPDNLPDKVREIVGRMLSSGECSVERVAATLELNPRVLQKRLQKIGSSYSALLRQTRQEIAEQHLQHGAMGVTELALNLGYADVAVFSRNFKRWTGLSPRQWQDVHRC